jgi:predicted nucleic acid-binding protein
MARLIESTLWVDFTRRSSPQALRARIQLWILDEHAAICEMVAFEVLRHANSRERPLIEAQFATLPLLPTPPRLWQRATALGQQCREAGVTVGSIDLLIAALALHHDAEAVTFDAYYLAIARAAPLRVTLLSRGEGS